MAIHVASDLKPILKNWYERYVEVWCKNKRYNQCKEDIYVWGGGGGGGGVKPNDRRINTKGEENIFLHPRVGLEI